MTPDSVVQIVRETLMLAFWVAAPMLAIGFLVGGYIGAVGAQHIPELWLRRIFALTLVAVGARMWFSR